jgi:hypothetical protein
MEQNNVGLFIDTTQIWDEYLQAAQENIDARELFLRLYQNINKIAIALNLKDSGIYSQTEFVNGQQWCPINEITNFVGTVGSASNQLNADPRQVYRKIVFCGALLNAAAKTNTSWHSDHSDTTRFVRIYGAANTINTAPTKLYKPIPCTGVDPIDLLVRSKSSITLNNDQLN